MGRPVLFVTGIQDINEIQTLAGLTVLSRVAKTAAEYGAQIEVPTCRSLVMAAARETVEAALVETLTPYYDGVGIRMDSACWIVSARAG